MPSGGRNSAIPIIAPLPVKERDRVSGEETGETRWLFKTVCVFDRSQVDPIDGVEQALLEPPNAQLRVLVHEMSHALGVGYREYGRERAEAIVDTATHLVCSSAPYRRMAATA